MKRIEKKTWPDLFEKMLRGEKIFDVRLADEEYKEGDILVLKEWDPETEEYTGRVLEKEITFAIKTKDIKFWDKEEVDKYGYVVVSLK